jgi:predicted TIM-barrel fold metal-dependent hydrolase
MPSRADGRGRPCDAEPVVIPKLLRRVSNGEYAPPRPSPLVREAAGRVADAADLAARRQRTTRRAFLRSSAGTAATLLALGACSKEERRAAGGGQPAGTFTVPPEATTDSEAAATTLAPFDGEVVIDVQTHFLDPDTIGFGGGFPQSDCSDDSATCFTIERWADLVLNSSDTALAVLSNLPIIADPHPMSIEKMEEARRLAATICGDDRVRLQGEAFPQVGELAETLDRMEELATAHRLVAWKTYTHIGGGGYAFTDPVGQAFLAQVSALASRGIGPPVVCVHKGLGADPVDVGPAAAAHPELTFCTYHAGYETSVTEGPFAEDGRGVDRLVRSLRDAGVGPGGNVYAELGSTWFNVLRRPDEAAHVLGKLLVAVGPERILWGTDSIWYGSPQDQIEAFRAFQISDEAQERFGYPALAPPVKRRILGANAAELHGLDLAGLARSCRAGAPDRAAGRNEALGRLGSLADEPLGPRTARQAAATFRAHHPWFR